MEIAELRDSYTLCRRCDWVGTCKQPVPGQLQGQNSRPIAMLIGEAPGQQEDDAGIPFIGKAGGLLRATLARAGIDEIYITNVLKHRPPGNKTPTRWEIESCLGFLIQEITIVNPLLVILAGKIADMGWYLACLTAYKQGDIPEFFSIYHPAYILRPTGARHRVAWEAEVMKIGERYRELGGVSYGERLGVAAIKDVVEPEPWSAPVWTFKHSLPLPYMAIDTETDDGEKDWHPKKVVLITVSDGNEATYLYPEAWQGSGSLHGHAYYHNAKYDLPLLNGDLDRLDSWDDTMLMAYVLREPMVGLKIVGPKYTGIPMDEYSDVVTIQEPNAKGKLKSRKMGFSEMLDRFPDRAVEYACKDAVVTSRLARVFTEMLAERPKLKRYYEEFEKPVTPLLYKMESGGVKIDTAKLEAAGHTMTEEMSHLTKIIQDWTGGDLDNPGSPRQVAAFLQECGYILKETKTGLPSADEATLDHITPRNEIDRQLIGFIKQYRTLSKMYGTYVKKLPEIVDDRGHAHARFNQTVTATNRLSSSDPINFQNIPNDDVYGPLIRGAFLPDEADHVWVKADFSQLELRIFAHYTHDPVLMAAYCGEEETDVHGQIAEALEIARPQAKNGIFATLYGVAQAKLAHTFGIPESEAGAFLGRMRKEMPSLLQWPEFIEAELMRELGVETWFGWWMPFPGYGSPVWSERQEALRQAMNGPIQGTASGVVKRLMAMVNVELRAGGKLREERCLLQVHDELGFSVHRDRLPFVSDVLREMGLAAGDGLDVPLRLDIKSGPNWYDVH